MTASGASRSIISMMPSWLRSGACVFGQFRLFVVISELALVTANLFLQPVESGIERMLRIDRLALRFQDNARVEMCGAVRAIAESFMRKHDIGFAAAVEMLAESRFDPLPYKIGQRRADFDLLARNPNLHGPHMDVNPV